MLFGLALVSLAVHCQAAQRVLHKEPVMPKTWEEFAQINGESMEGLYNQYKSTYGKNYGATEAGDRFTTFSDRVKAVFDWNKDKSHTYRKGINRFTDMTADERKHFVMPETKVEPNRPPKASKGESDMLSRTLNGAGDSKTCDLRPFSTAVKDQASCGSCWAFGTMAAAEASHFLWSQVDGSGNAVSGSLNNAWQLSEQVLMECCGRIYDSNGCGGGGVSGPLECAVKMGALPSSTSHPYKASTDNTTCQHSNSEAGAYVQAWYEPCTGNDEVCLKKYIGGDSCNQFYTTALKTSIEVIDSFYDYADGVYSDPACPDDIHNHAVAIVGWGTDDVSGKDYWIVRNSWNTDWGNSGYIYMERGTNMCCIACENLFFQ